MKQEYHRALEQICLSEEARARIISVLEQKERGLKRPRRRIGRLILVCAVLMLLLLGTGAAVVSRVGVLELFFQGDTSQLEPFVQTGASAQDKNYRLTLDSSICDGDTLYVVITVEGLHEQGGGKSEEQSGRCGLLSGGLGPRDAGESDGAGAGRHLRVSIPDGGREPYVQLRI